MKILNGKLDNFFTKAPVPSIQDHVHHMPTHSDSQTHAETPSNDIDSNITSEIEDEICSNPTTMSKPIYNNLSCSYPDISTLKDSVLLGKDVKFQLLTGTWKDVDTFKFPTR